MDFDPEKSWDFMDSLGFRWTRANRHKDACIEINRLRAEVETLRGALTLLWDHSRLYRPEVEDNNVGKAVRDALAVGRGE